MSKKSFWDDKYNKWLVAILIIAAIVRIYILVIAANQPLWWDEAGYMVKTKKIVLGWQWTDFWNPHKPILLSWMAIPFYLIGIGEIGIRIFIMLFSLFGVYMTYLVGKEYFNKKIGLIAAFLMSFFWVALFFTPRILTDLPASALLLVSLYYFSKGYIKKENPKYIWLSGLFLGITFLMRVSVGIMIVPFFIYMFLEERFKLFKNKNLGMAILLMIIIILPFFIWLYASYPAEPNAGLISKIYKPIDTFLGFSSGRFTPEYGGVMRVKGIWAYLKDQPYVFGPVLQGQNSILNTIGYLPFIIVLIGLILMIIDLILGIDLLFKKENKELRIKLFIVTMLIVTFISFGFTRSYVEQRDMLYILPFLYCLLALTLFKLSDFLDSYKKYLGVIVVVALLLVFAYLQLNWGVTLTKSKTTSYLPVKQAAIWMKDNSLPTDLIYTESKMQNLYYAERYTLAYGSREGYDIFANKTEQDFFAEVKEKKPKFMVISLFEGHATWMYENCYLPDSATQFCPFVWAENHNSTIYPVNAWYDSSNKQVPVLVIYAFSNYDFT